jgi:hypothetical protein
LDPMATHVSNFGAGKVMLEDARELAARNEILCRVAQRLIVRASIGRHKV